MAANRGDILDTSSKSSFRLLYMNILLCFLLILIDSSIIILDWRFNIVDNPIETVKYIAVVVAIVEPILFLSCGTDENTETYPVKPRFTDRICNLFKAVFIFLTSCAAIHLITVLYGAQVFEKIEETFYFSLLLSSLSVLPCLAVIGVRTESWTRLYFERCPDNEAELCLLYLVVCSYFGAWLGAFPIPLDWERPWQEWPITVCIGALLGHTTGVLLSIGHLLLRMNSEKSPQKYR